MISRPQIPLYLLSYDGGLHWGFTADWEQVPDLHDFALYIEEAFRELEEAAANAGK